MCQEHKSVLSFMISLKVKIFALPLAQIIKTSINYIAQLVWKEEFRTEK